VSGGVAAGGFLKRGFETVGGITQVEKCKHGTKFFVGVVTLGVCRHSNVATASLGDPCRMQYWFC